MSPLNWGQLRFSSSHPRVFIACSPVLNQTCESQRILPSRQIQNRIVHKQYTLTRYIGCPVKFKNEDRGKGWRRWVIYSRHGRLVTLLTFSGVCIDLSYTKDWEVGAGQLLRRPLLFVDVSPFLTGSLWFYIIAVSFRFPFFQGFPSHQSPQFTLSF